MDTRTDTDVDVLKVAGIVWLFGWRMAVAFFGLLQNVTVPVVVSLATEFLSLVLVIITISYSIWKWRRDIYKERLNYGQANATPAGPVAAPTGGQAGGQE